MTLRVCTEVASAQPIAGTYLFQERAGTPVSGSLLSLLPTENFARCSFEHDLCGWEAATGSPVWSRNTSLNLGTSYSIPTRDHSNNSRAGTWRGTSAPAEPHRRWTCPGVTHTWALLRTAVSCTHTSAQLHSAPAPPAGFFLHVGGGPTAQAGGTAQLISPTFQATSSCSVSHGWVLMS